jgi:aryl-alcohol dehydrogenase-like predicted oxidoreductase
MPVLREVELAIGWLLVQPAVSSVIIGSSSPEQVTANVAASTRGPSADVLEAVDDALRLS